MATYTIRIPRTAPHGVQAKVESYRVEAEPWWTVLDALNHIKEAQDGSLTYRRSCRHGICGSCAMTINGQNRLACETQLASLKAQTIAVEPLRSFRVIRDLVVDMEPLYRRMEVVRAWFICRKESPSDRERAQTPKDRRKLDGSYECILCGACTSSCPTVWADPDFLGPQALLKAWRFVADSRDDASAERLEIVNDKDGIWRCHTIFNCAEACPKELNPTKAIMALRRAVLRGKV